MKHAWLFSDFLHALKGERLSSVFSPDGTLISASAAPHCGVGGGGRGEGDWIGKVEISSRKKSLAVGEACMAIF